MEHTRPTLLWGIDCESGKISALPASPLLLPAAIVAAIFWIIGKIIPRKIKREPIPKGFNQQEWEKNKALYDYLCGKVSRGIPLSDSENIQFNCILPRPSWAKPGEWWTY